MSTKILLMKDVCLEPYRGVTLVDVVKIRN